VAKPRHELRAEAIRDIGILLAVFGPLDTVIIKAKQGDWQDWLVALLIAVLGLLLIIEGIGMESDT